MKIPHNPLNRGQAALLCFLLLISSCTYDQELPLHDVAARLEGAGGLTAGMLVTATDGNAVAHTATADADGIAHFRLPAGIYNVSVSAVTEVDGKKYVVNGNKAQHAVTTSPHSHLITIPLTVIEQDARGIIIKEVYCGGCQKDDGSGIFAIDKCIILYNNSPFDARIANLGIGMAEPYNAEATTHNFLNGGRLEYDQQGTLPLINGVWYFADTLRVKAYQEIVVNVCGAINNTLTYSHSVNYAHSSYYCMYDPSTMGADGKAYANTAYYPPPADVIPTSHYLKAVKYGRGNAWPFSTTSPAPVIFQTQGISVQTFAGDPSNIVYPTGKMGDLTVACLAIPRAWVLDGVEIYNADKLPDCKKRLTPDIDNGHASLTHGYGHSLVRRIDQTAAASVGHPVYIDTNNSTHDFVEVPSPSLP